MIKNIARRAAVVLSATAVTIGLLGAVAPAEAKTISGVASSARDTGWN